MGGKVERAKEVVMRKKWVAPVSLGLMILLARTLPAVAGDSLFGTVTAVRRADVVVFNYGTGEYTVRIAGINPPKDARLADRARRFVANLVQGKKARIRLEYRTPGGEMLSRLFTADTIAGIKDVGVELLRAGLAVRQPGYDYKYGELSLAENEARSARRGLWATTRR